MTHDGTIGPPPDGEAAASGASGGVVPAPAAEPATPASLSVPATPYRSWPEPPGLQLAAGRMSLVGAASFVFGVLLWGFVVMGELTTSYAPGKHHMLMGEALGVVFILVTTAVAWRAVQLRSLLISPGPPLATYARGAFLALAPLASWWFVVACAAGLGKAASKNLDGPITMLLLIVSVAAALGGRRLAGLRGPASTARRRAITRLLWAASILLTFVTLVEILGS